MEDFVGQSLGNTTKWKWLTSYFQAGKTFEFPSRGQHGWLSALKYYWLERNLNDSRNAENFLAILKLLSSYNIFQNGLLEKIKDAKFYAILADRVKSHND